MLFDIRGRRRHVVKFVYAILAVLMGLSLFLVTGAVNLTSLFGGESSTSSAVSGLEETNEKLERKLVKDPENPQLLITLTKSKIATANALVSEGSEGQLEYTLESRQKLAEASETWSQYLEATDKPTAGAALSVAPALFTLGELSSGPEIHDNIKAAAEAQEIVANAQPNLGTLSNLAIYQVFSFEYDQAQKTAAKAKKFATSKFQKEQLENQLKEDEKIARKFQKELKAGEAAQKAAGEEKLKNPLNSLGGSTLTE
jgi:hypothetical protein